MRYLPVFFEALCSLDSPRIRIVTQVRSLLFKQGVSPLPFARSRRELHLLLEAIAQTGQKPGLFVVNTHGAELMLGDLDEIIGATPVFFFRHKLLWAKEETEVLKTIYGVTQRIGKLRPRLTVTRRYGALNSEQVARRAARQIGSFARYGDFRSLEDQLKPEHSGFYRSSTA
ncbi:MAG: hypothetical protein HY291_04540 [Planctomycetes bacterium]|nr:hypothetical protein [Planctomycetota bacterium]